MALEKEIIKKSMPKLITHDEYLYGKRLLLRSSLRHVVTVNSSDCDTHSCDGYAMLYKLSDYGVSLAG